MTKDEALRLALEALEYHTEQTRPIPYTIAAIVKIKKVLLQQEAKDEPVAWIDERAIAWLAEHPHGNITTKLELQKSFERPTPLYTTTPQRKPLTDEEIYLCTNHIDRNVRGWANEFARAIEAAHGIKVEAK